MPIMAFIGVRISWLILAKKSDLRWVASSAASLALRSASSIFFRSVMSLKVMMRSVRSSSRARNTDTSTSMVLRSPHR